MDSVGQPIDTKLYTTFWNLQNVYKVRPMLPRGCGLLDDETRLPVHLVEMAGVLSSHSVSA